MQMHKPWRPERIREARKRAGLSQEHAAWAVGTNPDQWSRWENGHAHPQKRYRAPICELLGVSYAMLTGGTPFPPRESEARSALSSGPWKCSQLRKEWEAHRKRLDERDAGKREQLGQRRTPISRPSMIWHG
jgi:transcriptional regulator with XRE-family HTH domain